MKADVYFNLHNHHWSVRNFQTKRVEHYTTDVLLEDAKFIVGEKGRQRVIREKRKNVHAYARGIIKALALPFIEAELKAKGFKKAYYNPYTTPFFIDKETQAPLKETYSIYLNARDRSVWYKKE